MSKRSHNLAKYCIGLINHYMEVHDPESHFITSVGSEGLIEAR